jgi:Arc/MetJ family transcription regulator
MLRLSVLVALYTRPTAWLATAARYVYIYQYDTPRATMRTNIDIDDQLLQQALRATGLKTKRAVVEAGLRMLLHLKGQEEVLRLVGKVRWDGNLEESRQGRDFA